MGVRIFTEKGIFRNAEDKPLSVEYPDANKWVHVADGILVIVFQENSEKNVITERVIASFAHEAWANVEYM